MKSAVSGPFLFIMHSQDRGIIGNIAKSPIAYAVAFVAMFAATVWFLGQMDALPEPSKTSAPVVAQTPTVDETKVVPTSAQLPVRIEAEDIGLSVKVANPASTNVDTLDEELLSGAVRYPTSGKLGENGTVVIFGHSSYLPVVHNQAYKAFDGIQNLKKGEVVSVYSGTLEYRYMVETVSVANADEDVIELRKDGQYLTLVTCDSFTKKTDRFIVTAKFVGAYQLASN